MAVGDIFSLRIVGAFQSQNIVNTLHYRITEQTDSDIDVLTNALSDWDSNWKTDWLSVHCDGYNLWGLKAFGTGTSTLVPAFKSSSGNGAVAETAAPAGLARIMTLYTEHAKPQKRGRLSLSGGTTPMFSATYGAVTAAHLTALETAFGDLIDPIVGSGSTFVLVLYDRTLKTYEDVVSIQAKPSPGFYRSRNYRNMLIG